MQQLFKSWVQLTLRRQIVVILATVAMFLAVLVMSRMATAPSLTLLYAGLENGAAGDVVRALEQRNVAFEVRGGSIFVDSKERDQLRLTLASEGLPANNNSGYELLDSLTGFGTTAQMFDAAYWRAKEGELARTIVANPQIAAARVHIAGTGSNPFQRGVTPSASVSLTPNSGNITASQAKAVRYLIASAVAGLAPDGVSVIDANGALVGQADDVAPVAGGDDKAQVLRDRVQRLLEARVGLGNAVVEVSVETVTESEEIREHRFDPDSRVAISTDTEELTTSSKDGADGDVTVASNLPDKAGADGANSSSQNSETRERINYEVSETKREIVRAPGAIKRLTVAVLVNDGTGVDAEGNAISSPREESELSALRELVSSAVGFDEARGDIITIKSMALQPTAMGGTIATTSMFDRFSFDLMSALQLAVLALVSLILGLFVIRPILTKQPSAQQSMVPALPPVESGAEPEETTAALTGELDPEDEEYDVAQRGVTPGRDPQRSLGSQVDGTPLMNDPVTRLRTMIGERQEETVEILRSWLEDREENA